MHVFDRELKEQLIFLIEAMHCQRFNKRQLSSNFYGDDDDYDDDGDNQCTIVNCSTSSIIGAEHG